MTTVIAPASGAGILFTQQGVGATPGYGAVDDRRSGGIAFSQGPVGQGAYAVAQHAAGANMSVDIAATSGTGLVVIPTIVTDQGPYVVPPHNAVITETIGANASGNPRVDQVVVQTYDNAVDASGNNLAQTMVLAGTPTAGATIGLGGNRNGAGALPAGAIRLADVLVANGAASITNANIFDRRPKVRGYSIIATSEAFTQTGYATSTTADLITELVVPTGGLIEVMFFATWQESVGQAASAALFLNSTQATMAAKAGAGAFGPNGQNAGTGSTNAAVARPLLSTFGGLVGLGQTTGAYSGDSTTGQIVGAGASGGDLLVGAAGGSSWTPTVGGGPCYLFAAAGTYHLTVQYKSTSGSITVSSRRLYARVIDFGLGVLA